MSGANFRLTRCAISPRRNFLLRSSAAITSFDILAAERHHIDRREPQVGRHAHFRHRDRCGLRSPDHARRRATAFPPSRGGSVRRRAAGAGRGRRLSCRGCLFRGIDDLTCRHAPAQARTSRSRASRSVAYWMPGLQRGHDEQLDLVTTSDARLRLGLRASAAPSPPGSTRSRRRRACPGSSRTPCRIPGRPALRARRP